MASITTAIGVMLVLVGMTHDATAQDTPADAGPLVGDWSNIPQEVSCQLEYASDPQNNYQNYFPAIGAAEHTDAIHSGVQPCAVFTGNYQEQVTCRDAATGRLLAESDFFEPMTFGSLITPGFGGRVYFATSKGFIVLQVMPAATPHEVAK